MFIYILDLVGVFAFAFLGARSALERRLNLWGVLLCAFLTAVGGGTIRAILLNMMPAYFHNQTYGVVIVSGATASILLYRYFDRLKKMIFVLDAVGMVSFAYIGAHAARTAHLGPEAVICFAWLTACGGGVVADALIGKVPHVLRGGLIYATPPCIVGLAYWLFEAPLTRPGVVFIFLALAFALQLVATFAPLHGVRAYAAKMFARIISAHRRPYAYTYPWRFWL